MFPRVCVGLCLVLLLGPATGFDAEQVGNLAKRLNSKVPRLYGGERSLNGKRKQPSIIGGGECSWDASASECLPSFGKAAEILAGSDDGFVEFIAKQAKCRAEADEQACASTRLCEWNTEASRCTYEAYVEEYPDSPCEKSAPATSKGIEVADLCGEHTTQLPCIKDDNCHWDADEEFCEGSFFKGFYGISLDELIAASRSVVDEKVAELIEKFPKSFDTESPSFKWERVISWKPPATACPKWSNPLICTYVDGIMSVIGTGFYCGGKYGSETDILKCTADPKCYYDGEDSKCRAHAEAFFPGVLRGLKALTKYVEAPGDKKILSGIWECAGITTKPKCKGKCIWKHGLNGEESCTVKGSWIAASLAAPGAGGSDPICVDASILAKSGCLDAEADKCEENPNCQLRLSKDCIATVHYVVQKAVQRDAKVESIYDSLSKKCAAYKNEATCNNPPSLAIT